VGTGAGIASAYSASKFAIRGLTHAAGNAVFGAYSPWSMDFVDEEFLKLPISGNTALQ
jgi:hypothetical protein